MRTFYYLMVFAVLSVGLICQAQQSLTANSLQPTPYTIVQRSANSRVWESTSYELLPSGQVVSNLQHYTELATGLCYQQNGQWQDSEELISILRDGSAAATNGQHQVYFPGDIYNGVITLITPDGLQMQSRPLGLSYDDGTNTVMIAELTNSIGQLVGDNQVIYTNAFVGVSADILYTYRKGGFEQDVIFREQPPTPEQCGLNSANSRLQLLTEFFNTPTPVVSAVNVQDGLQDMTLNFGSMTMVHGRAFLAGIGTQNNLNSVPVFKSWGTVDGRTLLIEETPFERISPALKALPPSTSAITVSHNSTLYKVSSKRNLPLARGAENTASKVQLASADFAQKPGLVFDYITVGSTATNFTFQGDTTYYLSGEGDFSGVTTFEGGTVIKMLNTSPSQGMITINAGGAVNCVTAPYLPAVFTSKDDNSVGETISGSTGLPGFEQNVWCLWLNNTNINIHDLRFLYSLVSVGLGSANTDIKASNCQFLNGAVAVAGYNVSLYNILIGDLTNVTSAVVSNNLAQIFLEGPNLVAENVTADSGVGLVEDDGGGSVALTNCLVTSEGLYAPGTYAPTPSTNSVVCLPLPTGPIYQVVGGGNYYLTNGSPYRSYGTTNIDPTLLTNLAQRTTWPPIVYIATNITGLSVLYPTAPRDISSSLDLGYHYDPLDYIFGGCDLSTNLAITPGTAVGWFQHNGTYSGQPYSISLETGANLSFNGIATQPCFFPNYAMVQEGGNGTWTANGYIGGIMYNGNGSSPIPQISANFAKWTDPAGRNNFFRDAPAHGQGYFRNCEFYDGGMSTYDMQALSFTNCLFFRDVLAFWDQNTSLDFTNINCTYYNGGLGLVRSSGQPFSFWQIENSSFDGTAFGFNDNDSGSTNNTLFDYNAYNTNNLSWQTYSAFSPWLTMNGKLEDLGLHDINVTNFNWQISWFGNFYLPPDSLLIDAGSTNANYLGLYHFTTQTSQTVEGNSLVDIGYHYVATDGNGKPLDYNSDGIPDYLEDSNGNGLIDSGEIGWYISGDPGMTVIITNPHNGTTLP